VGVPHVFPVSTGRAGLTLLLQGLRRLSTADRTEILIPAYTCYSVPASIIKAGLRPRVVDIDPQTLDFAPDALAQAETDHALAIIATNLYGLPNDLPRLVSFARERGMFLVDDAAQALGARVGGRPSGTWGDAGLYSLDKGKNISSIDGGLIVTASEALARELQALVAPLPPASIGTVGMDLVKVLVYAAFLSPSTYWIPSAIPGLGLGQTRFTTDFPLHAMPAALARLAVTVLPRLDAYTETRRRHAYALIESLRAVPGLSLVREGADTFPVYLRLPVFIDTPRARAAVLDALTEAGLGATVSYPSALRDVPALVRAFDGMPDTPGGRAVAARLLTLPTHPAVSGDDRRRIVDLVQAVLRPESMIPAAAAS
jgi:dTDP-4-amino-4,6-dideoxygalactose transaminase